MSRKRKELQEAEQEVAEKWPVIHPQYLDKQLQNCDEKTAVIKIINDTYSVRIRNYKVFNPFVGALDSPIGEDYNQLEQYEWKPVNGRAYRYYREFLQSKDASKLFHTERLLNE